MPPAKNLKDAFNALRPEEPVSADDPEGFYVPRPIGHGIEQLKNWLELDEQINSKLLFTGHRGSGKSTELLRLARDMEEHYFVVSYSVERVLDIQDITYVDVLLSMASQLVGMAQERSIYLENRLVENLIRWSGETVKEWEEDASWEVNLGSK